MDEYPQKTKTQKGREKKLAKLQADAKERGLKETPTEIPPTKRARERFRRTKAERAKLQLALFERPEDLRKKLEGMDEAKREKVLLARALMISKARNKRRNKRRHSAGLIPTSRANKTVDDRNSGQKNAGVLWAKHKAKVAARKGSQSNKRITEGNKHLHG